MQFSIVKQSVTFITCAHSTRGAGRIHNTNSILIICSCNIFEKFFSLPKSDHFKIQKIILRIEFGLNQILKCIMYKLYYGSVCRLLLYFVFGLPLSMFSVNCVSNGF